MNITKISKLVLAIFLLLSVKCICEEGSLTSNQILASIKEEVKKIQIPTYQKPIDRGISIFVTETKGLEIKSVKTTSSNLENDLKKAELSENEISIMKGIIFVSKSSFKSFNFIAEQSLDDFNLRFSQFVGFANKQNNSIEVAFVNVAITATLYLNNIYRPVYKTNDKIAYDDGRMVSSYHPPTANEIYSATNFLKEHAKNELLKLK